MAVQAKVERAQSLREGKLELTVSVLVNGTVVGTETLILHNPHQLTLPQIRTKIRDRVLAFKEQYKQRQAAEALVGTVIDVEP